MFTEALFTVAKIQKQLKYSSRDEWIKKMWYRHIIFHPKKKEILQCDNMDEP